MSLAVATRSRSMFWGAWLLVAAAGLQAAAGTIAGRITEQGTGAPIPGIDLDVLDEQYQSVTTTAQSNASGNYQATGLPAGNYLIRADPTAAQGYVDQYNAGVFLRSQAPFLNVPSSGTVTVNFSLFKGANITGRVAVGSGPGAGSGAAGVDLDLYEAISGEFLASVNATTNNAGNYTIGSLPPGQYIQRADPLPSTFLLVRYYLAGDTRATATPITVVGTAPVSGIDFSLPRGGLIRGTVRAAGTLQPLAGMDLDLFDDAGAFQTANATTSATGSYELGPLLPGTYRVRADPTATSGYVQAYHLNSFLVAGATPVVVSVNTITAGVDVQLSRGGTISGAVRAAGSQTPLADVDLDVFDAASHAMPVDAKSDVLGHYLIGALPPASYFVRANPTAVQGYATQYYASTVFEADATPVAVVVGSDTPGVDFALTPGGSIEGIITGADTSQPLAGIDLDLFDVTGRFYSPVEAITSATGFYRLAPVPPGTWIVEADPTLAQGYVDEYYGGEYALSRATRILLDPGTARTDSNLVLDPGGTISGSIHHRDTGTPLAGVDLDVFFANRQRLDVTTRTDAAGNFLLGLLPAGAYLLRADPPAATGLEQQYYDGARDASSAQFIAVSVGQDHAGINFLLGPAATPTPTPSPSPTPRPGDLNGDGQITSLDLLLFALAWQSAEVQSPAELNGTPPVDQSDLLDLLKLFP